MKETLLYYADVLSHKLDPNVREDQAAVRAGYSLYQQGMVSPVMMDEPIITGRVQDLTPQEALLNLDTFDSHSCTCGSPSFCRHRTALFFHAYAEIASASDWVFGWNARKKTAESVLAALPVQPARKILEAGPAENDYEAWRTLIQTSFQTMIIEQWDSSPYIMEGHVRKYMQYIDSRKPLDRSWRTFYQFSADFMTLRSILDLLRVQQQYPQSIRIFYSIAADLFDDLLRRVLLLSKQARPFSSDSIIEGIRRDSESLLDGDEDLAYEKMELYRHIWTYLLTQHAARKEEAERISSFLESDSLSKEEETAFLIASIHHALLDEQDQSAAGLLRRLKTSDVPYLFYWLEMFSDAETPARALPYAEFTNKHIKAYITSISDYYQSMDFVRTFSKEMAACCLKLKRTDMLDKFYRETLPYSYWNYASLLLEQGQYKKWVELQIFSGITIDTIGQDKLKIVAAEDPELLLPLYHQAVQQTISLKNRPAYKQAIRYMKKMRTLYKKLKQEPEFEEYINYISASTKRLRAFQEELQRGKLIHVQ